jgi:predicted HD superfamily hydrolase involved in NAD metabolism
MNQIEREHLYERIEAQLAARLDDYGLRHCKSTAAMAKIMAGIYHVDPETAYLAGLLHDWDRCVPHDELVETARGIGIPITPEVLAAPPILHAHTGAAAVAAAFPEVPQEVITAIKHHTVGVPDMSDLDKLVYIADMIEPTRTNPHVDTLREMVGTIGLDALFMQAYQNTMMHLVRNKKVMHPATTKVWNALLLKEQESNNS